MHRRFFLKLLGLGAAGAAVAPTAIRAEAIRPIETAALPPLPETARLVFPDDVPWLFSGYVGSGHKATQPRDARGRFVRRIDYGNDTE